MKLLLNNYCPWCKKSSVNAHNTIQYFGNGIQPGGYLSLILRFNIGSSDFVKKINQAQDGHQNVLETKVTLNLTQRGRCEVCSASTRSNKYKIFVIWHCRECDSPPPSALFLHTSFRLAPCTKVCYRKPNGSVRKCKEKRTRRRRIALSTATRALSSDFSKFVSEYILEQYPNCAGLHEKS